MLRKSGIIFVILIVITALVMASASAVSTNTTQKTGDKGWVVTQGTPGATSSVGFSSIESSTSSISSMNTAFGSGTYSIIQGQTIFSSTYIPSQPGFTVDLNWGNCANSLQLMIYTADGAALGPYYDRADNRIDGRICLYISKGPGTNIPAGTYYVRVYGYQVSGAQSYTI